jgi:hypothetical protein
MAQHPASLSKRLVFAQQTVQRRYRTDIISFVEEGGDDFLGRRFGKTI